MVESHKVAYSISELPKITGFGRSKIYQEISAGRLVARKVGTRTIILASDLNDYLKCLPEIASKHSAGE